MNIPNIDKVILSIDVTGYDIKFDSFLKKLEELKNFSRVLIEEGKEKTKILLLDDYFSVKPNGERSKAYILEGYYYKIYFAQKRSKNDNFYPIKVDISSSALWAMSSMDSYKKIYEILNWIIEEYSEDKIEFVFKERVSRIDLCCHSDEIEINCESDEYFQCRSTKKNFIMDSDDYETYIRGSRKSPIICRIYNKTKEILASDKAWFISIWNDKGLEIFKVWNIEFELKRAFFLDMENNNGDKLNTFEEIYNNLKAIWGYCTTEWLVKKTLDKTRIERSSVSPDWIKIQSAFDGYNGTGYITRGHQVKAGAECIIPSLVGYITSYASKFPNMDLEDAIRSFKNEGASYLHHKKQTTFENIIQEKRLINLGGEYE